MTKDKQAALLRRMTRPQGQQVAENPLTSSRAVRLALTKASNDTVGLMLTVQGVADEVTGLDDMLGSLGDDLMLVGLERAGDLAGLIALDMDMRAAVLEMETMGAVLAQPAEPRAPTRTDKMLCDPLLAAFLAEFPAAVVGTPLEGWMNGILPGDKVKSGRSAGLILADCDYRVVRMTVDLGVAERQGMLVMALPLQQDPSPPQAEPLVAVDWGSKFQETVAEAPACLEALLHRFPVSLATAQSLQVGSILPLPGCTVSSVRLLSPGGQEVGQAKLGQVGGYRAVRLQAAPAPELADLRGASATVLPLPDTMEIEVVDKASDLADAAPAPQFKAASAQDRDAAAGDMPDMAGISQDHDPP